jgi:hypothetical protein
MILCAEMNKYACYNTALSLSLSLSLLVFVNEGKSTPGVSEEPPLTLVSNSSMSDCSASPARSSSSDSCVRVIHEEKSRHRDRYMYTTTDNNINENQKREREKQTGIWGDLGRGRAPEGLVTFAGQPLLPSKTPLLLRVRCLSAIPSRGAPWSLLCYCVVLVL